MNRRNIVAVLLLSLLLIMGLLMGCGPSETEEGETSGKKDVEIYTYFSGTSVYSVGVAMQELTNKESDTIRAMAIEGRDPTANVKLLLNDEEARKNTIIWGNPSELWSLRVGVRPYEEANNDIRPFLCNALVGELLVTMDPKIKTLVDLSGKRVAVPVGESSEVKYLEVLFEAAGAENVKFERLSFEEMMTSLADGRVDASVAYIYIFSMDPIEFQHGAESQEVLAVNKIYPVYKDKETIEKAKGMMGNDFPVVSFEVEPGKILDTQTEPYNVVAYASCFAAHVDIDPEIIKEFMRIYYENADKFVEYHPSAEFINTNTAGLLTSKPENIHPAGLEFVQEHGYKYHEGFDW